MNFNETINTVICGDVLDILKSKSKQQGLSNYIKNFPTPNARDSSRDTSPKRWDTTCFGCGKTFCYDDSYGHKGKWYCIDCLPTEISKIFLYLGKKLLDKIL